MKSKIYQFDKWLFVLFNCRLLKNHSWTAKIKHEQPTKKDLTYNGFLEFSRMYCKYCRHISKYSLELEKKGFGLATALKNTE